MKERAHHRGMDRKYLEGDYDDEEEDEDVSISAIKKKFKQGVQKGILFMFSKHR